MGKVEPFPANAGKVVRLPVIRRAVDANARAPILRTIEDGDAAAAATLIEAARAASSLTLRDDIELAAALLPLLATPKVAIADARRAAIALGLFDADGDLPAGAAFDRLRARFAAERWYDEVSAIAARRHPFDARTAAARRLIGRRPSLLRRFVHPRRELARLASELEPHREWLEGRLDPEGLDEARRSLT